MRSFLSTIFFTVALVFLVVSMWLDRRIATNGIKSLFETLEMKK